MDRPSILYKYMPSTYEEAPKTEDDYIRCLDNGMVKYSSIAALNDPHEFMPISFATDYHVGLEVKKMRHLDAINKMRISPREKARREEDICWRFELLQAAIEKQDPGMDHEIYRALYNTKVRKYGVFCLSETWQSLVMWHFYADSQSGVCIGWDSGLPIFQEGTAKRPGNDHGFFPLGKVEYVDNIEKEKMDVFTYVPDSKSMFTKHDDWSYEREWRSIVRWPSISYEVAQAANQQAGLIHLGTDSIREIIVGGKCPTVAKQKAAKFGKLHGIPVFSMALSTEHFGARREPLRL